MDVGEGMAMAGHKEEGGSKCTGTSCLDTQHPRKRTPDPADPNNHLGRPGGANLWSYYSLDPSSIYMGPEVVPFSCILFHEMEMRN